MHPFSIDYLTRDTSLDRSASPSQLSTSSGIRTPSPNSSLSSNSSPQISSTDPDVAKALRDLERQAACRPSAGIEKPPLSYIALISMAILSTSEKKMLLNEIYNWIMENFEYYNNNEKAWRNSVRHNLSLNECFTKSERSDNGKGHFWSIHPACVEDFKRGDYRRRQARRRAKRSTQEHQYQQQGAIHPTMMTVGYLPMPARYSPYAIPAMYGQNFQNFYAAPMSPMSPALPQMSPLSPIPPMSPMPTMSPMSPISHVQQRMTAMSPHPVYPSFPMSAAMFSPFPISQAHLKSFTQ